MTGPKTSLRWRAIAAALVVVAVPAMADAIVPTPVCQTTVICINPSCRLKPASPRDAWVTVFGNTCASR